MDRRFNLEEWILVHGKIYPGSNTPAQISRERRILLKIPLKHAANIPQPSKPITHLLSSTTLPSLIPTPPILATEFSIDPPILSTNYLPTLSLPPLAYTQSMLLLFGQAWFDGMHSVIDPTNKKRCLPFWILQYWLRMGHAITARAQWEAAHKWLLSLRNSVHPMSSVVQDALNSFQTLGWDVLLSEQTAGLQAAGLRPVALQSLNTAALLSTHMIRGGLVDAMIQLLVERVHLSPIHHQRVSVEDLTFSDTPIDHLPFRPWRLYRHCPALRRWDPAPLETLNQAFAACRRS
jgi:hypothetical protein